MGCEAFMEGGDLEERKLKQPILFGFVLQFKAAAFVFL